uniref:Uncharacterized protein n=1 Tax=Arundo donax TaxID=35708 RepID=A0A0A9C1H5_ARUDO
MQYLFRITNGKEYGPEMKRSVLQVLLEILIRLFQYMVIIPLVAVGLGTIHLFLTNRIVHLFPPFFHFGMAALLRQPVIVLKLIVFEAVRVSPGPSYGFHFRVQGSDIFHHFLF